MRIFQVVLQKNYHTLWNGLQRYASNLCSHICKTWDPEIHKKIKSTPINRLNIALFPGHIQCFNVYMTLNRHFHSYIQKRNIVHFAYLLTGSISFSSVSFWASVIQLLKCWHISRQSGNDRKKSLSNAAVTNTEHSTKSTSSSRSNLARNSRIARALGDRLKMPTVDGPSFRMWTSMAFRWERKQLLTHGNKDQMRNYKNIQVLRI